MAKKTQKTKSNTAPVADKVASEVAEKEVTKTVAKKEAVEPQRSGVDTYADILVLLNSDDVDFNVKQELLTESKLPSVVKLVSKFNHHVLELGDTGVDPGSDVVLSNNHDIMSCITDILGSADDEEFKVMFLLINMYFTAYGAHGQSLSLPMLTRYDYLSTKSNKYIRTYNLLTALIVKLAPYPTRKKQLKTVKIKDIFTPDNSVLTGTMISNLLAFYTA